MDGTETRGTKYLVPYAWTGCTLHSAESTYFIHNGAESYVTAHRASLKAFSVVRTYLEIP